MKISFWMIFTIFATVSAWAEKALADERVTLAEGLALVGELASILGVSTLYETPGKGEDLRLVVAGIEQAPVEVAEVRAATVQRE